MIMKILLALVLSVVISGVCYGRPHGYVGCQTTVSKTVVKTKTVNPVVPMTKTPSVCPIVEIPVVKVTPGVEVFTEKTVKPIQPLKKTAKVVGVVTKPVTKVVGAVVRPVGKALRVVSSFRPLKLVGRLFRR